MFLLLLTKGILQSQSEQGGKDDSEITGGKSKTLFRKSLSLTGSLRPINLRKECRVARQTFVCSNYGPNLCRYSAALINALARSPSVISPRSRRSRKVRYAASGFLVKK